jgi:hypothetical protein
MRRKEVTLHAPRYARQTECRPEVFSWLDPG